MNQTTIQDRNLKVPCCSACNNGPLSALESNIAKAVAGGFNHFLKLPKQQVALWAAKLFFGLLYRELFLPLDRSRPKSGNILYEEHLQEYQLIHFFLQSVRIPIKIESFEANYPVSLFIFDLQELSQNELNFDFRDDINLRTIFIRLGDIGILASFDAGTQSIEGEKFFGQYINEKLHPLQFEELGANLFYKASLLTRSPKVIIYEKDEEAIVQFMPIAGLSTKPIFAKWEVENYADFLSMFTAAPKKHINPIQGKIMTWLHNPEGEFMVLDVAKNPYRGVVP